jgi:hypothetical protein
MREVIVDATNRSGMSDTDAASGHKTAGNTAAKGVTSEAAAEPTCMAAETAAAHMARATAEAASFGNACRGRYDNCCGKRSSGCRL